MMIVAVTLTAIVFVKMYQSKLDVVGCVIQVADIVFLLRQTLAHACSIQARFQLSQLV